MRPIEVTYYQRSSFYEVEDHWTVGALMLMVCRDFNLWPSRVSFCTSEGDILDKKQIIGDLDSEGCCQLQEADSMNIIVKDLLPIGIREMQSDHVQEIKTPISIDIETIPQKLQVKQWIRPGDTLGTVIGTLLLNGSLSQIVDIRHNGHSLLEKEIRSSEDNDSSHNSDCDAELTSAQPAIGQLCLVEDIGLCEGDELEIIYPFSSEKAKDDEDPEYCDELTDPQSQLKDSVDVEIHMENHQKIIKKRLYSDDTTSSVLGDLLLDGHLNCRLGLSRNGQFLFDTSEMTSAEKSSSRDRSPLRENDLHLIKEESLVNYFKIKDDDRLEISFDGNGVMAHQEMEIEDDDEKMEILPILGMKDKIKEFPSSKYNDKSKSPSISIRLQFPETKIQPERVHIREKDSVSSVIKHVLRRGFAKHIHSLVYRGRNIQLENVPLLEDQRSLINDIKMSPRSRLNIITVKPYKVHVKCELPNKEKLHSFYISVEKDVKGKEIREHLTKKYQLNGQEIFLWQEMRFSEKKILFYEVDDTEDRVAWAMDTYDMDLEGQTSESRDRSHGSSLTIIKDMHSKDSFGRRRVVPLGNDTSIIFLYEKVPVVHARIRMKYRRLASDGIHLMPLPPSPDENNMSWLEDPSYLGWHMGLMIQDRIKDRHETWYYARTAKGYIDIKRGKFVSKEDLIKAAGIPIPKHDRCFYFFMLAISEGKMMPKYNIPPDGVIAVWLRDGNQSIFKDGIFTNPQKNSTTNAWVRAAHGYLGPEIYLAKWLQQFLKI